MSVNINVFFHFPRKMRRYCKIICFLLMFFAFMFYIHIKLNESEKNLRMDVAKIRSAKYRKADKKSEFQQYKHPNALESHDYNKKGKEMYQNSDTLVQKLRPKLRKPLLPVSGANGDNDDELWAGELGVAKNEKELRTREEGYKTFAFNTLVSSRIGLSRALPDPRHKECQKLSYSPDLPTASVIICYYHEDLTVLLRTIHSVLDRTPPSILNEVLVINDHSDIDITQNITQHIGT